MDKAGEYIEAAVRLARENLHKENGGPFGAVIVKDGKIIASGVNTVTTDHDPTAHAEINAIRNACKVLGSYQLEGCEVYSSCEPCPMCLGAIYWARPKALYYGASREEAGSAGFDDTHIYNEIPKAPTKRQLKTKQVYIPEASELFTLWKNTQRKIEY